MSKAKGIQTIRGKEAVLKTAVCAVEYDSGELYFDRTGRVVRQLVRGDRGWVGEALVGAKQTQVMNPAENLILTSSTTGAVLTLSVEQQPRGIEEEEVARLADHAAFALGVIVDELEIERFQRIGYREYYSFACDSVEETETWIKGLGLVHANDALYRVFGRHYAMSWAVLFTGEECRFRLEMQGTERSATIPVGQGEISIKQSRAKHLNRQELLALLTEKRHKQTDPEFAAVLDIDSYIWADTEPDFDIKGFVTRRAADNLNLFRKCLPQQGGQTS